MEYRDEYRSEAAALVAISRKLGGSASRSSGRQLGHWGIIEETVAGVKGAVSGSGRF